MVSGLLGIRSTSEYEACWREVELQGRFGNIGDGDCEIDVVFLRFGSRGALSPEHWGIEISIRCCPVAVQAPSRRQYDVCFGHLVPSGGGRGTKCLPSGVVCVDAMALFVGRVMSVRLARYENGKGLCKSRVIV